MGENRKPGSGDRTDAGARLLRTAAFTVVLVAGLKAAASLLIPILIAALLAIVFLPVVRLASRYRIPPLATIFIVGAALLVVVVLTGAVVARSIAEFRVSLLSESTAAADGDVGAVETRGLEETPPAVETPVEGTAESEASEAPSDVEPPGLRNRLERFLRRIGEILGIELSVERLTAMVHAENLMALVAETADEVLASLSNVVVILLIMIFLIFEAEGLPEKMRRAIGDPDADLSSYETVLSQVYGYVSIKTLLSFVTGVAATLLLFCTGVEYAVLLGLIAFLFNFVPNVGSIIAAVPAVLLALHGGNWVSALVVGVGYLVINLVIGNVVEPRLMGKRLGLSPVVVILSLVFWSWLWGPVGMILSVPMTMVFKIILENTEDFRSVAILLGPSRESSSDSP